MAEGAAGEEAPFIQRTADNAVFTLGRFQPPHIGHGALIGAVIDRAGTTEGGADAYVFVSDKHWRNTNATGKRKVAPANYVRYPLNSATRVAFMRRMFPAAVRIIDTKACPPSSRCNDYFSALSMLQKAGYATVTILLGSDRGEQAMARSLVERGATVLTVARDETIANLANPAGWSATKVRGLVNRNENANAFRAGVMMGSMTPANVSALRRTLRAELNAIRANIAARNITRKNGKH